MWCSDLVQWPAAWSGKSSRERGGLLCPFPAGKEPGLFDLVIINDNLDKAYAILKEALSEVGPASLLCPLRGARRVWGLSHATHVPGGRC